MLHLLYIFAFSILAVLAIVNLVRNLISLGIETRRGTGSVAASRPKQPRRVPHPELLDDDGNVLDEPLLVMRSISIKDAREQLDAIYESSGGGTSLEEPKED
ncbi:DUF2973 domain-containing protein [Leptothoe kymatousa]|uniref:DUF2973 domain-containing protein n=1 Tax=Leptothoe kymatousa TAU-MAC 1615 TaxID=2364775 RepID=A0ABS5XZZ1_9CYAN|nr:DUF2973 domain-containing protein [Leptothoe kymatousa]MBT9311130.1 DUF2973 domain-containing protein [Leptothoe kymatousa TAU-MAC 1615]